LEHDFHARVVNTLRFVEERGWALSAEKGAWALPPMFDPLVGTSASDEHGDQSFDRSSPVRIIPKPIGERWQAGELTADSLVLGI
jgi:hypothetical protein